MNTANKLTMLRVGMIPIFMIVLYLGFPGSQYVAAAIFALASLTDLIDGHIARRRDQITDFGNFMAPLADKVLVVAALLWFGEQGQAPAWAALIVVIREFAVTALRLIIVSGNGRVVAAGWSGKIKTALTMVGILVMLLRISPLVDDICVAVTVIATLYSGIEYFVQNKQAINWTK